jgi:hypothetical protein
MPGMVLVGKMTQIEGVDLLFLFMTGIHDQNGSCRQDDQISGFSAINFIEVGT